jgi:hypothetical protein
MKMFTRYSGLLCVGMLCTAAPAMAADVWLSCEGSVVTAKGKDSTKAAATDIYAYNDDVRALYRYSMTNKRLNIIPTSSYDAKAIVWGNPTKNLAAQEEQWQGSIDRAKMSLKQVRQQGDEIMTWDQVCKPTSAQPLG